MKKVKGNVRKRRREGDKARKKRDGRNGRQKKDSDPKRDGERRRIGNGKPIVDSVQLSRRVNFD